MNIPKHVRAVAFVVLTALICSVCNGQPDIYLSHSGFEDGNAATNVCASYTPGENFSVYVWVDENFEVMYGACLDFSISGPGVVAILDVEVFNPNITIVDIPINRRWQEVSSGINMIDTSVENICAVAVTSGTGILTSQITGSQFEDQLHDPNSQSFLFAKVDMTAVGTGDVEAMIADGPGGILGPIQNIVFGSIAINVSTTAIQYGDVDGSGAVNLLDVTPFVNLLSIGGCSVEADVNCDGALDLLDVARFVELLSN